MLSDVLIPISMFAAIAVVLWKYFDTKHKTRMAVIERGLVDENLKYLFGSFSARPNRFSVLKWGLAALLIGAALLLTIPLQQYSWATRHEGELITGMIFLGGGLAFVIYYGIVAKREKHEVD
jgi:hypothetical protein